MAQRIAGGEWKSSCRSVSLAAMPGYKKTAAASLLALAATGGARAAEPPLATVEFVVTVPPGTPEGEPIFLSGGAKALGGWSPKGVLLTKLPDGRYSARVELPIGSRIEFKVNRGSWALVEKGPGGAEVPN